MENGNCIEVSILPLLLKENKQFSALSCPIPNIKVDTHNAYQTSDSPPPSMMNACRNIARHAIYLEEVQKDTFIIMVSFGGIFITILFNLERE